MTRLVCLGKYDQRQQVAGLPARPDRSVPARSYRHGLSVHLDVARLFNAVVATGVLLLKRAGQDDTVSICFSKGLGCPMGSVLVGSKTQIAKARRIRKLFGGALRQAGIVAAGALYAMEHHVERLQIDHENAKAFAEAVHGVDGITVEPSEIETATRILFNVDPGTGPCGPARHSLQTCGVRINASGSHAACGPANAPRPSTARW